VFSRFGRMNLRNARHAEDGRPIDAGSSCPAARDYSRAYWHHLVKSGEILAMMALTAVNIAYYQELMACMRAAIAERRLADFIAETKAGWARGEAVG
jgi:queuine tRNA-ribosyltransferase